MKTKQIYELIFETENGEKMNLLFSSLKKAQNRKEKDYYLGNNYDGINGKSRITLSVITKRILF